MSEVNLFQWLLLGVYALTLVVVALYGVHRYVLVYLYVKHRRSVHVPKEQWTDLPRVTVQLPMFNEASVAERIIDATCAIDYPLEKLDIQVLDDSTDNSAEIARAAVEKWQAKGYPIEYIHRTNREGYKAGALAEATPRAKGDFIAIFDADFMPPTDILRNVVHHFTDPKVGMVQARWDHINRDASVLTRCQAMFLDAHFVIEHAARNKSGRFMHFNGTAGVWRRTTIEDAGGWQHDTLTEDLDLSYRAQMKGWNFIYLPQHAAPAELPPEIVSFKAQAHRWTKGGMQTCLKLLPGIMRSKRLPWKIKSEAFFHLSNTIVYPMVVLLTMLMYPAFIFAYGPFKHHQFSAWLFGATVFIVATCSAGSFFIYAQTILFGRQGFLKSLMYLPYLMALGVGLSINNSKAVFEAFFTRGGKRNNEFVRTPKYGVRANEDALGKAPAQAVQQSRKFPVSKLLIALLEIIFGAYITVFIVWTMLYPQALGYGAIPFLLIFAGGYFYVGVTTVYVLYRMHYATSTEEDAEPAEAIAN
jgi:cellulose synthase/poly-beta-1,6-N-acetylglucosamine synthase-like glycosyltransferase